MPRLSRTQLTLVLEREDRHRPIPHAPEGLVQALADLLLEALGAGSSVTTREGGDEHQDYA